jgi:small subunit ribosomal protein S3
MGQKVNPIGLRLGINRTWDSRWFARKEYGNLLLGDLGLRDFLQKRLAQAGVSRVVIERAARKTRITLHTARPGVVIGKKGVDIEKLRTDIAKLSKSEVSLNIVEIRKPEIEAKLIADNIAQQLERRVAFRRAMKRAVQSAIRLGAQGIRINCSGRLGARRSPEWNGIAKAAYPCIHCAPTSISVMAPPRRPTAFVALRFGSSKVKSSPTTRWRRKSG